MSGTIKTRMVYAVAASIALYGLTGTAQEKGGADMPPLIQVGENGTLIYQSDSRGNRIPDFSRCGYLGGGVKIPEVPTRKTLSPLQPGSGQALEGNTDDTARIQKALDGLGKLGVDENGFRGALLLKRGTYRVKGSLSINASGVILRGEGQGENGTIIIGTGTRKRTLINVGGRTRISEVKGSRRKIADSYVPWGALSFELESVNGLSVGDEIILFRPSTGNWIHDIGMDRIPNRPGRKTVQWAPGGYDFRFERVITEKVGKRITLDAPVVQAMEEKYGGGSVYRYMETGRISQAGVEHIRLVSAYKKGKEQEDEEHAWTGVSLDHVVNGWSRNLTMVHFSHGVTTGQNAKFVTVQDCGYFDPVSKITGGRRYPFSVNGQFCLVQRCYTREARHSQATGSKVRGPNVFLDCMNESTHGDTGPHHRWAVGVLWDNLKGGPFNAQDRGWMGTGHGWAGAMQVFWNCQTSSICVQQPPTSQNYAIGCTGKQSAGWRGSRGRRPGHYESHGKHVSPRSLYLGQLEDRLGRQAVENVTTEAQRQGTIYAELKKTFGQ